MPDNHRTPVRGARCRARGLAAGLATALLATSLPLTGTAVAATPLPGDGVLRLDFGPGAVADGHTGVGAGTAYSAERGYGFADTSAVSGTDRGTADPLRSDFVTPRDTSFAVDLPNADYTVRLIAGDAAGGTNIAIKAESIQKVQPTTKAAGQYLEMAFDIALVDGQLNLDFTGTDPNINALVITRQAPRGPGEKPTVFLAGDSTVQTYDPYWRPQAGWGQMLPRFFTDKATFVNRAIGGRSSKSFLVQGRLDEVLRQLRPNDYFFVQFGHNDATISVPERYASPADYKMYLKTYVEGARQRGATPVLVTPMGRRDFDPETGKFRVSFAEYVQAMKEVATELDVLLVDLSTLSIAYYDEMGPEGTKAVFMHVPAGIYEAWPNGNEDNTHFQEYGAIQLARMIANAVKDLPTPLAAQVKEVGQPPSVPPAPTGVVAGSISNAGAVLRWKASDTAEIYRVQRKLATEPDSAYQLAATSTIPTGSLGGLAEGTSYDVRVVAVNGRGESEPSAPLRFTTRSAQYRFDFGPVGSPVKAGYTEVTRSVLYTKERGYGLTSSTGMIDRDRGGADEVGRDFVAYFNGSYEFKVDLPNGTYAAKVITGDLLGSTRTNVAFEGKSFGSANSGSRVVSSKVFTGIQVADGQLNVGITGQTGHLNGLEITPLLLAPTGVTLESKDLASDPVSATISWNAVDGAASYRLYRQETGTATPVLVGETTGTTLRDTGGDLGVEYAYTVTAVDPTEVESVRSAPLTVAMVDPSVPKAATPDGLTLRSARKNDITFSWNAVDGARRYNVYRATKAGGPYTLVGRAGEASYTDTTVLTTIRYFYTVASVNVGGISERSEVLTTPAVTVLDWPMERIDRAPVAVKTAGGVYVGWRMLGLDPDSIAFNLYRDGVKLTVTPLRDSTNYLDALGNENSKYYVTAVEGRQERRVTEDFGVWQKQYLSVPLQKPADDYTKDGQPYTYRAGDASVGDLDGDGRYEIVLMWTPSNSKDNSQAGYTGITYLDAYRLDGQRLWRINLGPNVRAGAHYSPFLVYDFDNNGKAEVALKTADGTVDGRGQVIGDRYADHRNSSGYVLQGPEFLTIFDGLTGAAIDTVDYDPPRGDVSAWGDAYGNRVDRFLAAVAYLDGERPSLVFSRGYYTRTVLAAYDFVDGKLRKRWRFDTNDPGLSGYTGQGNHGLSIADVDRDGKDEITFGAMAVDDDGKPLYNTGLGHGDAMHLGDLDPTRDGLEVVDVHEHTDADYGLEMRDAATGQILWGVFTGKDTGRGMSADIDPRFPGEESWGATITNAQQIPHTAVYSARGQVVADTIPSSTNAGIWWDGDLLRELQDDNRIDKWNYLMSTTDNLLTATGAASNNGTKANPSLQADLFGDWREEIVWRSEDSSELRIYTTTAMTSHRIRTLMHDPVYRLGVAWQNVGYNQPPHPSFYLGDDMLAPPRPEIRYTGGPRYTFTGFEDPVGSGVNQIKAGQAVPLKWRITTTDGKPVTDLTSVRLSTRGTWCGQGWTADQPEEKLTGDSGPQNLGDGYYQINWKVPDNYAGSCKTLRLELGEDTYRTAEFAITG